VLNRTGQQGNVYQAHQHGKWNPQSSAYGRFWVDVPSGERNRRTVSLGLCATQWVARLRLREYIERAGVCSKRRFHQIPVPGTTFRQQAEWWMESLSTRRRRPLKPATIYGWQHCLDRWILPNLGNKLVSEVGNGALRQFVEILTAAGLAPKAIVNVVTVGETRRIPRVPPLSFCGTPQGGGAGRPHQTVARPFAKLDRPLRGATAVRRDLSEGMVRESWAGI
jgi:hypothetical protein